MIVSELYPRSHKTSLQKLSEPRWITDHLALKEDKRGLGVTACSCHTAEEIQGAASAVPRGPGGAIEHVPSLLSDPTPCRVPGLSGRVEDEACILDSTGGLGRAVCSPILSSLVPTHVMPPTQHPRDPFCGPQTSPPLEPACPTSAPFRHLPLLTDLNNTVLSNIQQGRRVTFSLCSIQHGSHWPREAPEHWPCGSCNQELHLFLIVFNFKLTLKSHKWAGMTSWRGGSGGGGWAYLLSQHIPFPENSPDNTPSPCHMCVLCWACSACWLTSVS